MRFRTLSGCNRTLSDLQDTASDRRHMHNGSIRPVRPVPPVRQRPRKRKILFAAVVWRVQSLEVEQTRKMETNKGPLFFSFFLFFFFYLIYSLLSYKKLHGGLAMAKAKSSELTTHTRVIPCWENAKPLKTKEPPPPQTAPKTKVSQIVTKQGRSHMTTTH